MDRNDMMNMDTLQRTVRITNPQGLHMRPSVAFAELAGRYECQVTVHHEGRSVDGKSPWDLLLLAAMPGTELTIEAAGPDAEEALDALIDLLSRPPEEEPPVPPKG
jgi:phosphotransferase system HPr (HPr) family protein